MVAFDEAAGDERCGTCRRDLEPGEWYSNILTDMCGDTVTCDIECLSCALTEDELAP